MTTLFQEMQTASTRGMVDGREEAMRRSENRFPRLYTIVCSLIGTKIYGIGLSSANTREAR
jgi:hypothetical protein